MKRVSFFAGLAAAAALTIVLVVLAAKEPAPVAPPDQPMVADIPFQKPSTAYPYVIHLDRHPAGPWNVPSKYACREYQIALMPTEDALQSLTLFKGEQVLLTDSGPLSDVTFDADCERVYWISQEYVSRYTIATNKTERRAIPKSAFPKEKVLDLGSDGVFYPTPNFLYVYGTDKSAEGPQPGIKILVSFDNPTTGRDGIANFSSQQVYDWKTGKWTLISLGKGMGPVVLDTEKEWVRMPEQIPGAASVSRRHDIFLSKLEDGYSGLKEPFMASDVCPFGGDENNEEYKDCREKELNKLFTDGHPELNAP